MKSHTHPKLNTQIYHEACEWFVEFRVDEPDETSRRAFHAWLQESPAHMEAYLDVTATWNESASLELQEKWPIATLIAQAACDPDIVVSHPSIPRPLSPAASEERQVSTRRFASPKLRLALAACVMLAAFTAALMTWPSSPLSYATGIGEQRSIVFPDGSTVNLNSRSRIRVRYSPRERAIDLLQGQALFSVAKDAARPFIVNTDSMRVRAVGTEFDVYRKTRGTTVTVLEGRVAVLDDHWQVTDARAPQDPGSQVAGAVTKANTVNTPAARPIFVAAGEQITVAPGVVSHPILANVAQAIAWTHRQLVFESAPLAQVAQEFNRYNERQLQIEDPELNTLEIDGVFSSTDPSALIRFLRARPGVQVTEAGSKIVITNR
jgi:transmembrane sensor